MKKKGLISFVIAMLICGCSCSKVNETTYNNAVSDFNSTDAISFTRIEKTVDNNDTSIYTKVTIEAKYIFDINRSNTVESMQYFISKDTGTFNESSIEYYYSNVTDTLYRYKHVTGSSIVTTKQSIGKFGDYFNVNRCNTVECLVAIPTNIAPILIIEDVTGFLIEEVDGVAVATYNALCPVYEQCHGNERLDYKLTIGGNGEIQSLTYTIPAETTTTTISYYFDGFGTQNVEITFPIELEKYPTGKID